MRNPNNKRVKHTIDIILSIILFITIMSVVFYLWNITTSPQKTKEGYTATITLVWRNVPPDLASNIRIHDPIFIANKPTYIVVNKWLTPYLRAIPTPTTATIVKSIDTYNIYLQIRNLQPITASVPPIGKELALIGNLIRIRSYIWQFDGIVVNLDIGPFSHPADYLTEPETTGCNYRIIARNVYPTVIDNMNTGEYLYDILGKEILILKDIKLVHPYIYGWTPNGVKAFPDPTKTDVLLTVSPLHERIPIEINGKPALVGSTLEVRGSNWRVWGRILEVTCP